MLNRKNFVLKASIFAIIVLAVILINGCGKLSPVAPDNGQGALSEPIGPPPSAAKGGGNLSGTQQNGGAHSMHYNMFSKIFSSRADSANLGMDYAFEFIVPEGALSDTTTITCQPTRFLSADTLVYVLEFGPDGLAFNHSVKIEFDFSALQDLNPDPTNPYTSAKLYYWDESASQWELQDTDTDVGDGIAELNIHHFSKYAIGGGSN